MVPAAFVDSFRERANCTDVPAPSGLTMSGGWQCTGAPECFPIASKPIEINQELLTLQDRLYCQFRLQIIKCAVDAFDGDIMGAYPASAVGHKVGKVENIL